MNAKYDVSLDVIRILLAICEDTSPELKEGRDIGLLEWAIDVVTVTRNWAGLAALNRNFDRLMVEAKYPQRQKRLKQLSDAIVKDFDLPTKYQRKRKAVSYLAFYRQVSTQWWKDDNGTSKKARELYTLLEKLETVRIEGSG